MPKKKPTDATIRNVKASHKRDTAQDAKVKDLQQRVTFLERLVTRLIKERVSGKQAAKVS